MVSFILRRTRHEALAQRGEPAAPAEYRHFVFVFALAWLVLCAQMLWMYSLPSAPALPDADDAKRLVQLRDFLAHRGWYDLHQPRLAPPAGYDSHWSRLIDAGLAGLYLFFRLFADPAVSERLMLMVWPMLWLVPAMAGVAMIAWRLGGYPAALLVLLFAAFCGPGMQQFLPGRIDHHNAHMALSLLVIGCTVCADRFRWAAATAGTLSALAIAIGFESLPYLLFCGAIFALRFIFDRGAGSYLRDYGIAIAAGTFAAFLLSVPPARWTAAVCDMIAINSALPVIVGGIAAAMIASWRSEKLVTRAALLGVAGTAAAAIFIGFEPRCLGGVYALDDPAIRPIWLDHVSETKTMFEMIQRNPAASVGAMAFPLLVLAALVWWMRRTAAYRAHAPLIAAAAFVLAFIYMLSVARGAPYAVWLGMPVAAMALLEALRTLNWKSRAGRFAVGFVLTPTAVTVGAIALVSAAGGTSRELRTASWQACVNEQNYAPLAALPKGVVAVNEMEWGPYVLAWTGHSVLAAPYHRLPSAIVASHMIFNSKPEDARHAAVQAGVDYLHVCNALPPLRANQAEWQASLIGRLKEGALPDWLTLVGSGPIAVYRVERSSRGAQ